MLLMRTLLTESQYISNMLQKVYYSMEVYKTKFC